jgi:RNA polymerase sigma factor (sigma-70 family)
VGDVELPDSIQSAPEQISDAALLRAFVARHDEAAFAELVRRYGPMVLGVCRRNLGHEQDAADAFQAVFVVLARKAGSIRAHEALASWLYHVAYRTSRKARALLRKRQERERQVTMMPEPSVAAEVVDDVFHVLDEELRALPAKYQESLILCELQGQSRKEAAAHLNVPEGTLSSRLAEGRKQLAARLRRRGIDITAAGLAAILAENAASASVPEPLLTAAQQAADPGAVSAPAATLSQSVVQGMLLAQVQLVALALLMPILLLAGLHAGLALSAPDEQAEVLAILQRLGARVEWKESAAGPYVSMVDLGGTKAEDAHLRRLTVFGGLRELRLNTAITDAGCPDLARLTKLEILRCEGCPLTDSGVKELGAMANLKTLVLTSTQMTDVGLKHLSRLTQLHEMNLRRTKVTDLGLDHLPGTRLRVLELGNTRVTDAGLPRLAKLRELQVLRLEGDSLTDAGLQALAAIKTLEALSLENNPAVTDAGLASLTLLPKLVRLNVSGTEVTDRGLPILAGLALQFLGCDRTTVTGAGLENAAAFASLKTLWLAGSKVTDDTVPFLAALPALQAVELGYTAISDAGVERLAPLKRLESLSLEKTRVTNDCLSSLATFGDLAALNLNATAVTDTGLKIIAARHRERSEFASLRILRVDKCAITDTGVDALGSLAKLEGLSLSGTDVTDAGLRTVGELRNLHLLRLSDCQISDVGLERIQALKNLRQLWLFRTQVTDAGLVFLKEMALLDDLRVDGSAVTDDKIHELRSYRSQRSIAMRRNKPSRPAEQPAPNDTSAPISLDDAARAPRAATRTLLTWLGVAGVAATSLASLSRAAGRRNPLWPGAVGGLVVAFVVSMAWLLQDPAAAAAQDAPKTPSQGPLRVLKGHTGPVRNMRFTPKGDKLISTSGWPGRDFSMRVWDVATGKEDYVIKYPQSVGAMELSRDGKLALIGTSVNSGIFLVEVETGKTVKHFPNNVSLLSIAFSPDEKHFYTGAQEGFARRWSIEEGREVASYPVKAKWCRYAAELPGGQVLTADSNTYVQIWDLASGMEVRHFEPPPGWLCHGNLLPGGDKVILAGWRVLLYDVRTGERSTQFEMHQGDVPNSRLSPDGKILLTASWDGTARLYNFATGDILRVLTQQDEFVTAIDITADSRLIATGGGGKRDGKNTLPGSDHAIRIWDLNTSAVAPASAPAPATGPRRWLVVAVGFGFAVLLGVLAFVLLRRPKTPPETSNEPTEPATPPLAFSCPKCQKTLKARPNLAGKKVKCPGCASAVTVPK